MVGKGRQDLDAVEWVSGTGWAAGNILRSSVSCNGCKVFLLRACFLNNVHIFFPFDLAIVVSCFILLFPIVVLHCV